MIPQITSHELQALFMGRVAFDIVGEVNIGIGLLKKLKGIHDHE